MCHQTVSLVARTLEEHGISTLVIGAAKDIVEYCGVPRFLCSDFPLGNPCGKPDDLSMQRQIMLQALELLESSQEARTTWQTPFEWGSDDWKTNYMKLTEENRAAMLAAGEERRKQQAG